MRDKRTAIHGNVQAIRNQLVDPLDDIFVLLEVDRFYSRALLCERQAFFDRVNADDPGGTLELRELGNTLANGTQTLEEHVSLQRVASRRLDIPRFPRYRPH